MARIDNNFTYPTGVKIGIQGKQATNSVLSANNYLGKKVEIEKKPNASLQVLFPITAGSFLLAIGASITAKVSYFIGATAMIFLIVASILKCIAAQPSPLSRSVSRHN